MPKPPLTWGRTLKYMTAAMPAVRIHFTIILPGSSDFMTENTTMNPTSPVATTAVAMVLINSMEANMARYRVAYARLLSTRLIRLFGKRNVSSFLPRDAVGMPGAAQGGVIRDEA